MTVRRTIAPLAVLALALAPTPALARRHIVAPGDPGSSQYQEDIPTASGSRPVASLAPATPASPQALVVLPVRAVHKLDHRGPAGRLTVSLAQQTAPPTLPITHPTYRVLSYHAAGALSVVTNALLGSGGGMGVFLPVIIFLALAAMLLVLVRRRER